MKRQLVKTGSSLAVTLPAEAVDTFGLQKGQEVDVSIHPGTGATTIRLESGSSTTAGRARASGRS